MADNSVFITGSAKGAFEDALATLPPWATEKTAFKISGLMVQQVKILNDLKKTLGSGGLGGGLDPVAQAKYNSELDKAAKILAENNKEEAKKKKRDKEQAESDKKRLIGAKEFENKWQKAKFVLDSVAVAGTALLKVDQQYMKTSGDLYKSGINLMNGNNESANSIMSLNQAVTLTGLRLETLQAVAEKYANTINAVGFSKFAKATGLATQGLKDLGFSGPQTAELMGTYVESMQNFTDIRNRSEQELADDATRLGAQMGKLSVMVGISQKQLEANLAANTKSTESTLIFSAKGELAAKNMELFASTFKEQGVGKFFEAMSAASDPVYTAGFKALQQAGLGDIANNLAQIGKSAEILGPEAARKQLNEYAKTIDPGRFQGLQDQLANHSEGAQEAADMLAGVTREARNTTNSTKKQADQAVASESVLTKWDTEVERSKAILQAAFPPLESQIVTLTNRLKDLNDVAYSVIKHTDADTRSWINAGGVVAGFIAGTLLPMVGNIKSVMNLFSKSGGVAAEAAEGAATAAKGAATAAEGATAVAGTGAAAGAASILGVTAAGIFALYETSRLGMALKDLWDAKHHEGVKLSAGSQERIKSGELDRRQTELKTPVPSTINSPSAVAPQSEWDDNSPASSPAPTAPVGPGIDKSPVSTDINSTLAAHTNILQQILLATESNVSVNKDILKYARNT